MLSSVQNPRVKAVAKLQQKKQRELAKQFIIEGAHLVEEASKHLLVDSVYTLEENPRYKRATVVSEHVMKKMTDAKNPPQIMAVANMPKVEPAFQRVLVLENIQDPGNVGTLIRSASAFGFDTVIIDKSADPYSPKVVRATQGALFNVSVIEMTFQAFTQAHPDVTIVATQVTNEEDKPNRPSAPFALILGNEGAGVSDYALAKADMKIHIPTHTVESLNVAVAGSILMHQLGATLSQGIFKG